MSDLDYRQFRSMVKNVALQVSRNFPQYVSAEDTEGVLWLWLYEKRESIRKTVESSPSTWEAQISSTLRKVASDHCAKEKAATEGYDPRDMYVYSPHKIESLLAVVFEHEDWQSFAMDWDPTPKGKRQSNESGDKLAELSDISKALQALPDETYNTILWVYKYHLTMEELAGELDISLEAAKKRIQRARESLQRQLGRKSSEEPSKVTGRRVVRTNAAARAMLANQYDG